MRDRGRTTGDRSKYMRDRGRTTGDRSEYMRDRGSITVEVSLIIPFVFMVIMFCIFIIANVWVDAKAQETGYSNIYDYTCSASSNNQIKNGWAISTPEKIVGFGGYINRKITYKTEVDKCTDRLRRWQLYGDVFSK